MRIRTTLIILLSFIIIATSCVRNSGKSEEDKLKDSLLKYLSENTFDEIEIKPKDTIDFSKIIISEDSVDLALFNLILGHESFSENRLIENIEILINQGADPNAVIEYQYSVRKFGTYIPIVKHFYRNKYRTHSDNSTAFHEAVNISKLKVTEKMIELGADVNAPSKNGVYPVDLAVKNGDKRILKLLKDNKCDFRFANTALSEDIDIIEWIVAEGADPDLININFALYDIELLKRVLNLNPDLASNELNYSEIFSNDKILDLLLEAGLNDNAKGKFPDECPPIYGAIKYGNLNSIKKLKKAGLNIHVKCSSGFNDSPFLFIIKRGDTEMLNYYLNNEKVNPNEKDWTKKSALIIAVNSDNNEIVELLLNAGANIEYSGYFNKTPLMHAVDFDHYISAQTLIEAGANVNYVNQYNETALTVAIQDFNLPMTKLMVENGADLKKKYKGLTLSQYAKSIDAPSMIVDYLQDHEK